MIEYVLWLPCEEWNMLGHCCLKQWHLRRVMTMIHRIMWGMLRLERDQWFKTLRAPAEGSRNHIKTKQNEVLHGKVSWVVEVPAEVRYKMFRVYMYWGVNRVSSWQTKKPYFCLQSLWTENCWTWGEYSFASCYTSI